MRTTQLVQASAEIVTVTTLKAGDVYKRLQVNTYGEKYALQFGVVQDVMHNGEDAVVTALEFEVAYTGVTPALKTFGTDSDLKLFEAQPDEVLAHFADLRTAARAAVQKAEDELRKQSTMAQQVEQVIARVADLPLTAPATRVGLPAAEPDNDQDTDDRQAAGEAAAQQDTEPQF